MEAENQDQRQRPPFAHGPLCELRDPRPKLIPLPPPPQLPGEAKEAGVPQQYEIPNIPLKPSQSGLGFPTMKIPAFNIIPLMQKVGGWRNGSLKGESDEEDNFYS